MNLNRPLQIPELLDPDVWRYKGEGNANMVLAYNGIDPAHFGLVMRLPKTDVTTTLAEKDSVNEEALPFQKDDVLFDSVHYSVNVIAELLGHDRVGNIVILAVTSQFLCNIAKRILPDRPPKRRHKDIDTSSKWATLCADHTHFSKYLTKDTLSVEIKPKWGFLPTSPFKSSAFREVKNSTCRFCMHQCLKQPDPNRQSRYCPMDLYSLKRERVENAILSMLKESQNNFKLYINGYLRDMNDAEVKRKLDELLGIPSNDVEHDTKYLTRLLSETLLDDPILTRLKVLQKSLDELDIEGIHSIWKETINGEFAETIRNPSREDWTRVVESYRDRMRGRVRDDGSKDCGNDECVSLEDMSGDERVQRVLEFLISATLKDCSMLLTFQVIDDENPPQSDQQPSLPSDCAAPTLAEHLEGPIRQLTFPVESDDNEHAAVERKSFRYKLRFVDLDPKSSTRIPKYAELDKQIVQNWIDRGQQRECIA